MRTQTFFSRSFGVVLSFVLLAQAAGAQAAMDGLGVSRLYIHQARGLEAFRSGRDVLLARGPRAG